jgi:hypothetical protein
MLTAESAPMAKQRHAHVWQADPHGHYPEPLWTSARLFDVESFGVNGALVLDPCSGWGRIPHNATAVGYSAIGIDIVDRRHESFAYNGFPFFCGDFLQDPVLLPAITSAIFNPPYHGDYIQRFIERTLDIVDYKVAALVPLRRLPAMHWIEGKPLESIWILTPQPSLPPASYIRAGNEPSGGGQDFAWLVFNRLTSVDAPRTRWLHRE